MEQRFALDGGTGALMVREEGLRAVVTAERPDDGLGLYKAYLRGPGGRISLGTLAPDGGVLRVRRTLSLDELRRRGAWPPRGGGAELSFPFAGTDAPSGWRWVRPEELPLREAELLRKAVRLGRVLCREGEERLTLAYPFSTRREFPYPELFCLARLMSVEGELRALFDFSREGEPLLPKI